MHYCIGDVHGCYEAMMRMIFEIESRDPNAVICFLGDLIDRGLDSYRVLTWAMDHFSEDGRYRTILGNHEDLILQWYYYRFLPWYRTPSETKEPMPVTRFDFSKVAKEHGMVTQETCVPCYPLSGIPAHSKGAFHQRASVCSCPCLV